jgi:hypothetical protein
MGKKIQKSIAERRAFLKKAGTAAAAVPAAALLLSAEKAQAVPGNPSGGIVIDSANS